MFMDASVAPLPPLFKCFIPIIGQKFSTNKTWFIGEFLMSSYYTVFDMSQLDDHGYLQIGIGEANNQDLIGKTLIDKHTEAVQ